MPIIGSRVTVGTTPVVLLSPTYGSVGDPVTGSLLNLGAQDVDLGGATVTTGAGYLLRVGGTFDVDLISGDVLYGVTASGTSSICILKLRQ